jgi:sigma-B regulation protein RsbU (phosphoserine phosphatase)
MNGAPSEAAPRGTSGAITHSLRDYWTDGSVARLCAALSKLTGIEFELRDERGLVLDDQGGEGEVRPIPSGARVLPVRVGEAAIGSVVVGPGEPDQGSRMIVERVGELITSMTREMCADVAELRLRIKEIEVLYRLNALLVAGGRVDDTLGLALDAALETLDLDAGAIMLLPEDSEGLTRIDREDELTRSASRGLSEGWLSDPTPLSDDRRFDRACLEGKVVTVEDLREDERVRAREMVEREGLVSFIGSGMVFEGRPIGVIRLYSKTKRAFTGSERRLIRSIGQSAAMGVEQARLLKLKARERRTQRALKLAAQVQQRMLPARIPRVEGLDLAARFRPSAEIAGDFYDLFEMRGKLGIIVGDVVGKGVGAGLLMSAVRATLRAYAELSDDVARVMERTNDAITRDTTVSEFATIWFGLYDPSERRLDYVTAGHEPPILITRDANGDVDGWRTGLLEGSGLVAGVQEHEEYEMCSRVLAPGEALIVYTDGVTDAIDFQKNRFGRPRLMEAAASIVGEEPDSSAEHIAERLVWHVRQFTGLARRVDDETFVVLRAKEG